MTEIRPCDVEVNPVGALTNAFGKYEAEAIAALLVRWHQVHSPERWVPVSIEDIIQLVETDTLASKWASCPIGSPDPWELINLGLVVGWLAGDTKEARLSSKGMLTQTALDLIANRGKWKDVLR